MSIVTKKGDRMETTLLSGETVEKSSLRVEAYGTVDELNSHLGLVRANVGGMEGENTPTLAREIRELQMELFRFASELACKDPGGQEWVEPTGEGHVELIEGRIAALEAEVKLPPSFIIPGACRASAMMDVARAVARRLERRVVKLAGEGEYDNQHGLVFANRLSDYLFMLARAIEHFTDVPFDTKGDTL